MEQLTPFRLTLPLSLPAADRDSLLVALQTEAEVQTSGQKDPTLEAILAIVKQAGDVADAIVKIAALASLMYNWAQALRKRGIIPNVTLFRPNQPELNLSRVQSVEEIEEWLRRVTR